VQWGVGLPDLDEIPGRRRRRTRMSGFAAADEVPRERAPRSDHDEQVRRRALDGNRQKKQGSCRWTS